MSNQLFKNNVPNSLLFNLLDKICIKTDKFYTVNNISFKIGTYNNEIQKFLTKCIPYYHSSKQKYLERTLTYNSFLTVIRQICNNNNIEFKSEIMYNRSNYEIVYYIYYSNVNDELV